MKTIFNHFDPALERCQVLLQDVSFRGLENYRGRALCLTDECDIIQIPNTIDCGWDWITDHYERIGLMHTKQVIWDSSFARISEFPEYGHSVFMFTDEAHKVRSDDVRLRIVDTMNSKNNFVEICGRLGIATPETVCYLSKDDFHVDDLLFPVYLKADVSVSGLGVVRCATPDDLSLHVSRMRQGDKFQVQQELNALAFVNLQYRVTNGALHKVAITEQILDGNSHNGNVFPSQFDVWSLMDPLAHSMHESGIKDLFAFDVAITEDGPIAIECNPRFNGSTYPTIAAQKLGIKSWMATNIEVSVNSFENFSLNGLEYDSETGRGIIVINWGCILNKKLGILIAGADKEDQMRILCKAQEIL